MANYHKGADDERHVIALAEAAGCLCVRSAGSLGPVDVLVSDPESGEWYALDIKRNVWAPPDDRAFMAGKLYPANAWPILVCVTIAKGRRVVHFRRVMPSGDMGLPTLMAPWSTELRGWLAAVAPKPKRPGERSKPCE